MASIDDWSDLFPDTAELSELAGRDAYGKPSYGSAATYSVRVVFKDELTRDANGREVLAKGSVWIQGTPTITPEYELTLSNGNTHPILSVEIPQDETGSHHVKVMFG